MVDHAFFGDFQGWVCDMRELALALAVLMAGSGVSVAGDAIEAACRSSGNTASFALCRCIQDVADATLAGAEQRRAATFFRDPERAQKLRQSVSQSNATFWQRYEHFATTAQLLCINI